MCPENCHPLSGGHVFQDWWFSLPATGRGANWGIDFPISAHVPHCPGDRAAWRGRWPCPSSGDCCCHRTSPGRKWEGEQSPGWGGDTHFPSAPPALPALGGGGAGTFLVAAWARTPLAAQRTCRGSAPAAGRPAPMWPVRRCGSRVGCWEAGGHSVGRGTRTGTAPHGRPGPVKQGAGQPGPPSPTSL